MNAAREHTVAAFETVRRRVNMASAFVVIAHAALGAAFGAALGWYGGSPPWVRLLLAAVAAAASGAWAFGRRPEVAAGRLIERRHPECRNVLVTAEELLSGSLDTSGAAAERVFHRAAEMLRQIDARRAAAVETRIALSLAVTAVCASLVYWLWRA